MDTKKALKEAYKQRKFRIGVFGIRNKVNGKLFVGSSVNLDAIWNRMRVELNYGMLRYEALQQDWKEYGEENFVFEIISELEQTEGDNKDYTKEVKQLEQMFIEEMQPFGEKGYNIPKL